MLGPSSYLRASWFSPPIWILTNWLVTQFILESNPTPPICQAFLALPLAPKTSHNPKFILAFKHSGLTTNKGKYSAPFLQRPSPSCGRLVLDSTAPCGEPPPLYFRFIIGCLLVDRITLSNPYQISPRRSMRGTKTLHLPNRKTPHMETGPILYSNLLCTSDLTFKTPTGR